MDTDDLMMLAYFHEAKGDMTRYVKWDELLPDLYKEFPHIMEAKQRLENARRTLDILVAAEWGKEIV